MTLTKMYADMHEQSSTEMFNTMEKIVNDNTVAILDNLRDYVKYDCERYGLPDVCIDEIYKEIIAKIAYASIKV